MALGDRFKQRVRALVDSRLSGPQARAAVATFARARAAEQSQLRGSQPIARYVDGRAGAAEESVRLDGGQIVYVWSNIAQAAQFALLKAVELSPERSGAYKRGWFLVVDGTPWTGPLASIPPGSAVTLTNKEPYHRKIDTGGQRTSVAPLITEQVRQAVKRKFPSLQASRTFVTIPGGYTLQGHAFRSGLHFDRKARKFTRVHARVATNRADARKGQALTYPAVVISEAI